MKYIKQLDSLRALTILSVIIVHWFPTDNFFHSVSEKFYGPTVFFTLSGFLITSILLKERKKAEASGLGKMGALKNFYIKRGLRLLPGYFLIIAIFCFFTPEHKEVFEIKYYLTFTLNFYIFKIQQWPALAHLWSMSVEEQFYLIWPCIILFVNKKYLLFIIILAIAVGVTSQLIMSGAEFSDILTITCLQSLGMGALLAWMITVKPPILERIYKTIGMVASISFAFYLFQCNFLQAPLINNQILISLLTTLVIVFFLKRNENKFYLFSFLMDNKTLMSMGKMSYGMYLYHFIIPYYTYSAFAKINNQLPFPSAIRNNKYLWIAENFCLLIIISYVSYNFFETPITNLKNKITKRTGKVIVEEQTGGLVL